MEIFKLIAVAVAGLLWLTWLVLSLQEAGVHPVRYVLDQYGRLGNGGKIVVLFLVVQMTMFGGAKHGGTNDVDDVIGTNGVEIVEGGTNDVGGAEGGMDGGDGLPPLMMARMLQLPSVDGPSITEEDLIRGYRLESIVTNADISYAMPSDAVIRGTWHVRGAYEDVMKVDFGDFRFPLGSRLCDSFWVYTWGKVRPKLRDVANEIVAGGFPMSAVPGQSRFWTEDMTNGGYLMTWEDFFLDRDTNTPANVQIELCGNGDFTTRFNDIEATYRRVIQPNPITPDNLPDPLNPTMPIHPYGPVQDLSVIDDANAYCWVDIVVERADAWVRFEGDGSSNLSDPSFAARAGETNHVIILIGKTYKVTCDMPFSVRTKSDPAIDEWWEDAHTLWLNWPVSIWSQGDDEDMPFLLLGAGNGSRDPQGFTMYVWPTCLGGSFTWTNCCCSISGGGNHFSYNCNGGCGCGGCSANGYYCYEGYRIGCSGGWCGCGGYDDPDEPRDDDPDFPPQVGISASFSKSVIFLEDEYANTPSNVVPWYSDTSSLCCSAWGGPNGGYVTVTISGDSNLIQLNGQTLPYTCDLEPYETIGFTNTYKAASESGRFQEIEVTATFIENETGWSETACPKATAVRVEIEPIVSREACPNRHRMGIREIFHVWTFPESLASELRKEDGWVRPNNGDQKSVQCPYESDANGVSVRVDGDDYRPVINAIEPTAIVCNSGTVLDLGYDAGRAGGIGMSIFPYIQPEDVCFSGVKMMEIPTLVGAEPPEGYFTNVNYSHIWSHTMTNHAGEWHRPGSDNLFFNDAPTFDEPCPQPWSYGKINWDIPIGWAALDATSSAEIVKELPVSYNQIFEIDGQGGLKVEKFGQWVKRMPSGEITQSSGIINTNGGAQ